MFEADSHGITLFHTREHQSRTSERVITSAGSLLYAHTISHAAHVRHVKQLNGNSHKGNQEKLLSDLLLLEVRYTEIETKDTQTERARD